MKRLASIFSIMVVLLSCQPEEMPVVQDQGNIAKNTDFESDDDLMKFLQDYGYKLADVKDLGESYSIDKCILVDKTLLKAGHYRNTIKGSENAHAIMTTLVTAPHWNRRTIRVMIDSSIPTSGVDNWRPEIAQALADLSGLRNFSLIFELVTSGTYDILIKNDLNSFGVGILPPGALAGARSPAGQNPGYEIIINLDFTTNDPYFGPIYNWTVPSATKRRAMVHELGHTIGFHHTDYLALGESTGDKIFVSGTSHTVPGSVMNGNTAELPWVGFDAFDIIAFRDVYPIDPGEKGLFTYVKNHSATIKSHNWTGYWSENSQILNSGHLYRGATGFVYLYQKAGTVPLYRYNHTSGTKYMTVNPNLANSYPSYTLDKIIGYVYTAPFTGRQPVYEYYHNNEGHYFTPFSNDPYVSGAGWTGGAVAFYVEWFD